MNRPRTPATHVVLIGMMGTGKSTVGRLVADALQRPFLDSDDAVAQRFGRSVSEIFEVDGEARFRELECEVMADLLSSPTPSVIAAAGGTVLRPETRTRMGASGTVVWLRAPVEVLVGRTERGTHRPALASDPRATLMQMEQDREPLYREVADLVVDADAPLASVVSQVVASVSTESDQ